MTTSYARLLPELTHEQKATLAKKRLNLEEYKFDTNVDGLISNEETKTAHNEYSDKINSVSELRKDLANFPYIPDDFEDRLNSLREYIKIAENNLLATFNKDIKEEKDSAGNEDTPKKKLEKMLAQNRKKADNAFKEMQTLSARLLSDHLSNHINPADTQNSAELNADGKEIPDKFELHTSDTASFKGSFANKMWKILQGDEWLGIGQALGTNVYVDKKNKTATFRLGYVNNEKKAKQALDALDLLHKLNNEPFKQITLNGGENYCRYMYVQAKLRGLEVACKTLSTQDRLVLDKEVKTKKEKIDKQENELKDKFKKIEPAGLRSALIEHERNRLENNPGLVKECLKMIEAGRMVGIVATGDDDAAGKYFGAFLGTVVAATYVAGYIALTPARLIAYALIDLANGKKPTARYFGNYHGSSELEIDIEKLNKIQKDDLNNGIKNALMAGNNGDAKNESHWNNLQVALKRNGISLPDSFKKLHNKEIDAWRNQAAGVYAHANGGSPAEPLRRSAPPGMVNAGANAKARLALEEVVEMGELSPRRPSIAPASQ